VTAKTFAERFGPSVTVEGSDESFAVVALHGGHVLSWISGLGEDRLFLSSSASRTSNDGTPIGIRGGIPVCFPQFAGLGPLPKHGFARTAMWTLIDEGVFELNVGPTDWPGWEHSCRLELALEVSSDRLDVRFSATNTGPTTWSFTGALHTYLSTNDVRSLIVGGIEGFRAVDHQLGHIPQEGPLTFAGEVDRNILAVSNPVEVRERSKSSAARLYTVHSDGFPDVVVWNIGAEKAPGLKDLGDGEWANYVCIEAALVETACVVAPGQTWTGTQTIIADS
jgi:glucose-6-phosphate 1-epimerase